MADRRATTTSSNSKAEVTNPFFSHIPKYQYSSSPPPAASNHHHMQLSASPPVNTANTLLDHRLHDQPPPHPSSYMSSSYEPNHMTSSIPIYHQPHQQQPSLISSSPKNQFMYSNSNAVRKTSMSASPPPPQQQQSAMIQPTMYLERTGSGKSTYGSGTYGRAHHEKLPPCKPDVIDNATELDAGAIAANGKGASDTLREDQGTIIKHRFFVNIERESIYEERAL